MPFCIEKSFEFLTREDGNKCPTQTDYIADLGPASAPLKSWGVFPLTSVGAGSSSESYIMLLIYENVHWFKWEFCAQNNGRMARNEMIGT